jgi:hypothetical protein
MLSFEQLKKMPLEALLEELSRGTTGGTDGRDRLEIIPPFIWVRTAEMVDRQLSGTAETIGKSANGLKDALNHSTETVKATLENSSEWLTNALKVNTDVAAKSAKEIDARIATLTVAPTQAKQRSSRRRREKC